MSTFFRFPHTPHLTWLGEGSPRDDKVLAKSEVTDLLKGEVIVEEKLDGANLGISVDSRGLIRIQNRGQYLEAPFSGQFARLSSWLPLREEAMADEIGSNLILFGEWCSARHSLDYLTLPDWFLAFDVYDRSSGRFWSTARRNELVARLSLPVVPAVFAGKTSMQELKPLLLHSTSRFREGPLEGLVIRKENSEWLEARAKLVHPNFTQAITEHWSRRGLEWNRLANVEAALTT
jgi:ATP-dependent RNA circularization protein (DNA/RNA ligase family)